MHSRREFIKNSSLIGISSMMLSANVPAQANSTKLAGFQNQDWFIETSFDLRTDLENANKQGKILTLLWEQSGCSYCRKMHEVAFRNQEIVEFIKSQFTVMQMDMWGGRNFVSMDGDNVDETALARSYLVRGTPSAIFFDEAGSAVFQLPGYAEPPIFLAVFQFVQEKAYAKQSFNSWYKARS